MPLRDNPILINHPLGCRQDFFDALTAISYRDCVTARPAPTNLDAMADLLREARAGTIIASDWRLDDADTSRISDVLGDLGITLCR